MSKQKMGKGESRKLKADYARDKTDSQSQEEKREVARRKGSSKNAKS